MILKKFKNDKKRGFTLIEMVVVVVIIGILSSMALIKYDKVQQDAKIKADTAVASSIATAATIAYNDKKDNEGITMEYLIKEKYFDADIKCNTTNVAFYVNVTPEGKVSVESDEHKFYPKYEPPKNSTSSEDTVKP